MADGKWIHGLKPSTPLAEAARHVLGVRLEMVREHLSPARHEATKDREHVHQLRVGTRRADAALRIFRPCLPGRVYRAARARLRAIRQAAGTARDWDVFLIALQTRMSQVAESEWPGLDFLVGFALGQRASAQGQLAAIETDEEEPFPDFMQNVLDAVRPPRDEGAVELLDLAQPMLARRLVRLHEAVAGNLKEHAQLHQVRIAGKRLRYAMEIFADCYPLAFRDRLYPMVEEMQETLGRANDSHVFCQQLVALRKQLRDWPTTWERVRPGFEALLKFHQRRLPQERRRFLKWWSAWREAGVETVLSEPAAR